MLENLKKAWEGEGPDFKPRPERRRWRRMHFGPGLRLAALVIFALIVLRIGFDMSPPVRGRWQVWSRERRLTGPNENDWAQAAAELSLDGKIGETILVKATRDRRAGVREAALDALIKGRFDSDVVVFEALKRALDDSEAPIRVLAIKGLVQVVPRRAQRDLDDDGDGDVTPLGPIVVRLVPLLKDPDPEVRIEAAKALPKFGALSPEVVADLTALLNDPEHEVRETAASILVNHDPTNEAAIKVLVAAFAESSPAHDGWPALDSLLECGPDVTAAIVPTLVKHLQADEPFAQLHVIRALKRIGRPASKALPHLRAFADGPGANTQHLPLQNQAFLTMRRAGVMTTPLMMGSTVGGGQAMCFHYETAMAVIAIEGKMTAWSLSKLTRIVTDPNELPEIRGLAGREVKKADPAAIAALLPALIEQFLTEKDPQARRHGFDMLMEIDPDAIKKAIAGEPIPERVRQ